MEPEVVDTDYEFVVTNDTGFDFVVYRHGSADSVGVWETLAPLDATGTTAYSSEIGLSYALRFCMEGDGPENSRAGVDYSFSTADTQHWTLLERHLHW